MKLEKPTFKQICFNHCLGDYDTEKAWNDYNNPELSFRNLWPELNRSINMYFLGWRDCHIHDCMERYAKGE